MPMPDDVKYSLIRMALILVAILVAVAIGYVALKIGYTDDSKK